MVQGILKSRSKLFGYLYLGLSLTVCFFQGAYILRNLESAYLQITYQSVKYQDSTPSRIQSSVWIPASAILEDVPRPQLSQQPQLTKLLQTAEVSVSDHEAVTWNIVDWLDTLLIPTAWLLAYILISYLLYRFIREKNAQSNSALQNVTAFQEAILNGANYSIISTDTRGLINSINKATETLLGYRSSEIVNKMNFTALFPEEQLQSHVKLLNERFGVNIQEPFEIFTYPIDRTLTKESEWQCIKKDRTRVSCLLSMSAIYDASNQITGYLGIISDNTEREQARQSLAESEIKYRSLFESAGDCIFLMASERFVDCNPQTLRMFNCEMSDIIGNTPGQFSPKYQPDGSLSEDKSRKLIQQALSGKPLHFEWTHMRKGGITFDAEVTLNSIQIRDDTMLLASVRDISERKANEKKLNEYQIELVKRNEYLRLANQLSLRVHGLEKVSEIINTTVTTLITELNAPLVAFFQLDESGSRLELVAQQGIDENLIKLGRFLPLENNPSAVALNENRVAIVEDFQTAKNMIPDLQKALIDAGFKSSAVLPLKYGGTPLGVIILLYTNYINFERQLVETMGSIANVVALAISSARNLESLRIQASHDSLTGLANRKLLHSEFNDHVARQDSENPTLFLIDLDRFKEINDTLGHQTGDLLLKQIGPRLEAVVPTNAIVCRLGGDEFAILVFQLSEDAKSVATRLQAAIKKPFKIDQLTLEIDCSIGIAHYPIHGENSHDLLRSADVAMYVAKQSKYGYMEYDENLDFNTPERLALITELNRAAEEQQLILHYQPKFDFTTSEIVGFEALVRWNHPERGLLYPDEFIIMAELSEAIHPMTEGIILAAVEQLNHWKKNAKPYPIAINLSSRNLIDDRCLVFLQKTIRDTGIEPSLLELEITETMLMKDPEKAAMILNGMSELGIGISIDDFGTGYSSLAYLHRLPINNLKIDRTFVKDMIKNKHDHMIVKSTIELAHNLGLKVIAEGVEDIDTLMQLKEIGCDQAQGYFISKPYPADYFTPEVISKTDYFIR